MFTLSYSEDCPPYETAFSASHLFQQTRHQADIAGFYRAFGVHPRGDRPDHLSMELEFCYLLALRESRAREAGDKEAVSFCRNTERVFLREHLARWVPSIAGRISLAAKGGFHGAAASALSAFIEWEEGFLRLGKVERYRDEPWPVDPLEEFQCPLDEPGPVEDLLQVETSHASAMDRLRRLSPGAWAFVFAAAVAIVGGVVSPVPVRSQVPRLDATPAPTAIPNDDPWSAVWEGAPSRQVLLSAQQITPPFGGGGVASLTVRALHDNGRVFILLEWYDDDVDDAVNGERPVRRRSGAAVPGGCR